MTKLIATYDYHSLANLSADGKRALAIGKGKFKHYPDAVVEYAYATVFDTETGAIIAQYNDYRNPEAMSLSPDGKIVVLLFHLAMAGSDPRDPTFEYPLIIWNTQDNTSIDCGRQLKFSEIAWLDNARFVLMHQKGYSSVELTVYDASEAKLSQFDYKGYGSGMAVNRNIAIGIQNQIYLINPSTGDEIKRFSLGEHDRIAENHRSLFYAPNGNHIATLQDNNNKVILVWDVHTDAPPIELKADKYVYTIAWSPDSTQLLSAESGDDDVSSSSNIYLWDIATSEKKLFTEINYERHGFVQSLHWHGNKIYITFLLRSMMVWEV